MNKKLISLMAAALALLSASGQVEFTGVGEHHVIELTPEKSTGVDKIYVLFDINGVEMKFNSSTGEPAKWETFTYQNNKLVMEPVVDVRWNGLATTLSKIIPNIGYKIDDGNHPFYCWVVNYADYYMTVNGISFNNEAPCNLVSFNIDGQADAIHYGKSQTLDREIELTYQTLEWDDSLHWQSKDVVEPFAALDQSVSIDPPLCNTTFTLSRDRFLKEWGLGRDITTDTYITQAVGCGTTAVLVANDNSTTKLEQIVKNASAPARIRFTGYPTAAATYCEWQMSLDQEFENIEMQYSGEEFEYTFIDPGTYYVRFYAVNSETGCECYSDPYIITVSVSKLECPNVFSPGSTPGVNDVWKVSYKSLVDFHCWIFNRWGNLVCEFTDPGSGWDGTYHGRLVDTGVYYYVVTALGSDGVKYKKRGDITILRYKKGEGSGTGTGTIDTGGY